MIRTLHRATFWPWNDRLGRFSALRLVVFVSLFAPAGWIYYQWHEAMLFPRVLNELIHQSGDWAVRLIIVALAVTPLRHAAQWSKLVSVRRMIGLAAMAYTLGHFAFYCVDQGLSLPKIVSEIALRFYLTIGFVALIGLILLGITSTDNMIRDLGPLIWMRLHKIVHAIAVLAVLHFFMQSKIDASEATLMLGFLIFLEGCRWLIHRRISLTFRPLAGLAVGAALATALLEAGWYGIATKIPAAAILHANLDLDIMIRPSWWVLTAGLAFAVLGGIRNRGQAPKPKQRAERDRMVTARA